MYLDYYGLEKNPFSISPDPTFLWFGPKHQEAFAALRYGIMAEKGFLCLTGEVGTGKTVLIRNLINTIEVPTIIISVPDPDMKPYEFFRYVAQEIKLKGKFHNKADFLMQFQTHVNAAFGTDTRVLMIIDEAQRLNLPLLEQIRLLSNIVSTQKRQLNIFLVGQNELDDLLLDERARATRQRIVVRHKLEPLALEEVTAYMYHRMQVAGADRLIFMPDAIEAVALQTNGIPRAINVICDQALLLGFKENASMINAGIVNRCPAAEELPQTTVEEDQIESPPEHTFEGEDFDQDATPAAPQKTVKPLKFRQAMVAFLTVAILVAGLGAYQYFSSKIGTPDYREMRKNAPQILRDEPVRPVQSAEIRKPKSGPESDTHGVVRPDRRQEVSGKKVLGEVGEKRKTDSALETETQSAPVQDKLAEGVQEKTPLRRGGSGNNGGGETGTVSGSGGVAAAIDRVPDRAARSLKKRSRLILYFRFDSTELMAKSANDLRKYISDLSLDSDTTFMVAGYTDSSGDYWYNKKLSQRRANAVRDLLIAGGVDRANILSMGMGSDDPQAERGPNYDSRKSRRVEVVLTRPR
jgi:general secretion pathway protein A